MNFSTRKLLAAAAATVVAAPALAGMSVSVRSDLVNTPAYKDRYNGDLSQVTGLTSNFAQIDFDAKLGSSMQIFGGFNLRNFITVPTGTTSGGPYDLNRVMNPDTFTAFLYITKKFDDSNYLSVGKLVTKLGGYENRRVKVGDAYLASLANGGAGGLPNKIVRNLAVGGGATGSTSTEDIVVTPDNASGVDYSYVMGDHKVSVQVFNSSNATDASVNTSTSPTLTVTSAAINRQLYGLVYDGKVGGIGLTAGYFMGNKDTNAYKPSTGSFSNTQINTTHTNLGFAGTVANLDYAVDYIMNTQKTDTTGAKQTFTTSTVGYFKYEMGNLDPIFKLESSEHQSAENANSVDSFKRTSYTVGFEYKPVNEENFRYHAIMASAKDSYGAAGTRGNDTVNWSQFIVGVKYTGDLLK